MHRLVIPLIAAALAVSTLLGCSGPKAPRITRAPAYPILLKAVHVVVNRPEFTEPAIEGLTKAGVPIAANQDDLFYMLRVDVGKPHWSLNCGTNRNVRYRLTYAIPPQTRVDRQLNTWYKSEHKFQGERAIQMGGKGPTGDCAENIFEQMGVALRAQMMEPSEKQSEGTTIDLEQATDTRLH